MEIQKGAVAKSYMTNGLPFCDFPHIGSPSSYVTLQPLLSEFPNTYMRKISFSLLSVGDQLSKGVTFTKKIRFLSRPT
jgi:hypothetical protein